ncbi:hypothetical protein FHS15_001551 [Paenibacillus castaneae]|uniref:hypothetical protein n=1 Tax=Paenibacillus castaneae TaxID=474957 RepID=UPI000C9B49E4|nr:hypothetical protein [Paenibacillus castaneae]NIK76426.1 hypothetical protein [Paenibacillus castaneae]
MSFIVRESQEQDFEEVLSKFYKKYGFVENHRMMRIYLPFLDKDLTPFAQIEDKLNTKGIMIKTLDEELVSDANVFQNCKRLSNRVSYASNVS